MGDLSTNPFNLLQRPISADLPPEPPAAPAETELELPQGPQSEDVRAAVDATIATDATVQERNTAYREVQAYVDRAQGSDHTSIDDASMLRIAVHVQGQHDVPSRFRPEVLDAVDRELSPSAEPAQEIQAYEQIQRYVDGVGGIGDAGITAEALPARASTLLDEAGFPTVAAEARAEAGRILDVGVRDNWLPGNQEDDYGARFDAYEQSVRGQSEAYREHLNAALLEADPGALKSWLTVDALVSARNDGDIDAAAFESATESVAKAYNAGAIDGDSFAGHYERGPIGEQVQNGETLLAFLGGSSGPETVQLRETLAQKTLDAFYPESFKAGATLEGGVYVQLNLALRIAAGDPEHPEILTDLLLAQSEENRNTILSVAGQLGAREHQDLGYEDAMAVIFSAVANDERPEAAELATSLARLPGEHSDWFDQGQVGRNEALADMLGTHSETVLDDLSEYEDAGARGLGDDTDRKQFEVNGRDLAAVLELTTFNPEIASSHRENARQGVLDYFGEQAKIVNDSRGETNSSGYEDAAGRLVVISAAADVAVDRGFEQLQADIEAKQEAIAFVVDLALVAVPLPTRLEARASGQLETLFANNPLVQEALTGLTGQIIDTATGQLTDAAKQQLYGNLDSNPELAALVERQTVADAFRESALGGISDERDRTQIRHDANSLSDDISEID